MRANVRLSPIKMVSFCDRPPSSGALHTGALNFALRASFLLLLLLAARIEAPKMDASETMKVSMRRISRAI